MKNVYSYKEPIKLGLFRRLINKNTDENFAIEINNLLAENKLDKISLGDINKIFEKYDNDILSKCQERLAELYSSYLKYCLEDRKLSANEINDLKHLKYLLYLTDKNIIKIHNSVIGNYYKTNYENIIDDGELTVEEEDFLKALREELHIPEDLASNISNEVRTDFINNFINNSVSDRRLSPEEETQLEKISKSLNAKLEYDEATKYLLNKYKLYWTIENGEIPEIDVPISLLNGEKCFFQTQSEWNEMRTITKRIDYGGISTRLKITKGLSFRVGTILPNKITNEEIQTIETGTLYLTNKRIMLIGQNKNLSLKLDKILAFTPYSDGIELTKEGGRNPILKFNNNVEMFSLILSRLLNN